MVQSGEGLSLLSSSAMVDAGYFWSCFVRPATCVVGFTAAIWVDITEGSCGSFAGLVTTLDDNKQGISIYCRTTDRIG